MDNLKDLEAMAVIVKEFRTISKMNRQIILNVLNQEHEIVGDKIEDPFHEIKERYLAAGGRENSRGLIPFIKEVREASGRDLLSGYPKLGLKEAKDLVEGW